MNPESSPHISDQSSGETAHPEIITPEAESSPVQARPELSEDEQQELIDQAMDSSERYQGLLEELAQARAARNPQREAEAVGLIRSLEASVKAELFPGTVTESAEHKEARQEKLHNLAQRFSSLDGGEPDDVTLTAMGMLDADGKFKYPRDVFSPRTDEAWDTYMEIVRKHEAVLGHARDLGITNVELDAIDGERRRKHNELTRLMMTDLGLDSDDQGDQFYRTRQLAAKMRDRRFPNMGELAIAAKLSSQFLDETRQRIKGMDKTSD